MNQASQKAVYWVEGISCLDCATSFEKHVAALPGVAAATLNTTTGRLVVDVNVSDASNGAHAGDGVSNGSAFVHVDHIRRLGRAEDYVILTDEEKTVQKRTPGTEKAVTVVPAAELARVIVSGLLLAVAWMLSRWDAFFVPGYVPVALYSGAIVIGGWSNARRAYYALPRLDFNMSVLMTVAVIGAAVIGEWTEGAVVAFLFALSDMLEAWTYGRARRSIHQLIASAPKHATVRRPVDAHGSAVFIEVDIPVEDIVVGDVVIIRPGEKIPVDGQVTVGRSAVEEAAITGESIPVEKQPGMVVYAGTLNTYGALEVHVTKPSSETTIAKIISLVEEAEASRPRSQAFVDRFAAVYTPIVMALALLIAVVPPLVVGAAWSAWIYRGLALLVVACPCALVVATPVSVVSAVSSAARRGVLIKGGVYLEQLAKVKAVAFDKTGTLTTGKPVVTDIVVFNDQGDVRADADLSRGDSVFDETHLLQVTASLERRSEHPIAAAIARAAEQRDIALLPLADFRAVPGHGVEGRFEGTLPSVPHGESGDTSEARDRGGAIAVIAAAGETVYAGNRRMFEAKASLNERVAGELHRLQQEGKTTVIVGTASRVFGVVALADEVRPAAMPTVTQLKQAGIKHVAMLTGDNEPAAKATAATLNIDAVRAELLPEHKVDALTGLMDLHGEVAMVGDGVNDAPALARATVGIAMGGAGTDAALETSDIVLMSDDLYKLPYVMRLSRAMVRIVKQNIYFAIAIKLVAILAVFPGWLTLWLAILADMGATVIVTLNGMRLLGHEIRGKETG